MGATVSGVLCDVLSSGLNNDISARQANGDEHPGESVATRLKPRENTATRKSKDNHITKLIYSQ